MLIVWTAWGEKENLLAAKWASKRIFGKRENVFGPCSTMTVIKRDQIVAVMVYHNYHKESGIIEISGAGDKHKWLNKSTLYQMFAYPFRQLAVQLVVMRVSAKDKMLKRLLNNFGFKCYMIPRLRGRYEDENIFTLTIEDWEDRTNGKKGTITAAAT